MDKKKGSEKGRKKGKGMEIKKVAGSRKIRIKESMKEWMKGMSTGKA